MNVLQRIAQIEEESQKSSADGRTKGMEIAMSLKQRIQTSNGSTGRKEGKRSLKKRWRKLLDKVEDSFSDNEIYSSGMKFKIGKTLPALAVVAHSPQVLEEESDSGSSLGSDGSGIPASGGVKLLKKRFYTFGEDVRQLPKATPPPSVGSGLAASGTGYDSGLYSGNYSHYHTSIGDY